MKKSKGTKSLKLSLRKIYEAMSSVIYNRVLAKIMPAYNKMQMVLNELYPFFLKYEERVSGSSLNIDPQSNSANWNILL